ncbi:MAG: formylmethanofuran dehydrogenase subunit C [Planctomycetaceae bacterium]|nr:formylmethanofuran dehydrogenase subunit C [Planctomycetaceae bacterium]
MVLSLRYKATTSIPVEVEGITPNAVRNLSISEIEHLEAFQGNQKTSLAEFFDVSGDPTDGEMIWEGDLHGVHWIGAKMTDGKIVVEGNAGRHIGSEMTGGEIIVNGDAGDWVGGEMHGGFIHVHGRAGHLIGAAYRGSARGMTGGTILIDGAVGNEIGHTMRRGLLAVGGDAGDLAGFNMLAGSILVFGSAGIRHGAGMKRGTIGFFGEEAPPLLPTFRHACRYCPDVLSLIFGKLRSRGFPLPAAVDTMIDLYNGDLIEGGRGEIFMRVL